jgi:hypothetical protein
MEQGGRASLQRRDGLLYSRSRPFGSETETKDQSDDKTHSSRIESCHGMVQHGFIGEDRYDTVAPIRRGAPHRDDILQAG